MAKPEKKSLNVTTIYEKRRRSVVYRVTIKLSRNGRVVIKEEIRAFVEQCQIPPRSDEDASTSSG
ncbi:unnamed protein product [Clavelina lepadiformis]|uniref:Uncharacterized protein n=1 Tax=Clavelina lepadiformis TaxID=159417 RepID=A0ABP0GYT2_CLALP